MEHIEIGTESAAGGVATPLTGTVCAWRQCGLPIVAPRRGQKFCSAKCRVAAYDEAHPRINAPGVREPEDDRPIKLRIRDLLGDGRQRTTAEIAFDLRINETTAARELRKLRHDLGAPVRSASPYGPSKPAVFWMSPAQQEG